MTEISSMLITHVKANVEDIEKLHAWHGGVDKILERLYSHELVEECAVLMTCNRVEVYVVSPKGSKVLFHFARMMKVPNLIVDFLDHEESMRHLMRLTSGLESMIVGEDQILGQVKDLYNLAKQTGTTGKMLDTVFSKSIQVGKRVRNETDINRGSVSIGSAAVELADDVLGNLDGKTVMIIGAGEMGSLVARALANKNIKVIYVANRTFERADTLACELNGKAIKYDLINEYIRESDVVISATAAPHMVITKEMMEGVMKEHKRDILLIDIANPRDIDESTKEVDGVRLFNIDSLKSISEKNLERRKSEISKVENIIDEELRLLRIQYKRQQADRIISALYSMINEIRCHERDAAINKLKAYHTIGEIETEVLNDLTHSVANKILAEPTKTLRNAAEHDNELFLDTVAELFRLNGNKNNKNN
ncbi:MAG: glutamyl-tRNA reductase [Methanosarcinales archaeon]|nr:glutamyl-tRNA reductase [ANME-2 cluster archaeon]MDF1531138.1 glutamyl-tRNA reductase [ANME-2 cluster archaeon]MDW7777186.1 glutamyl-tRNA reductase [Methanosarcinales archaeon]